MAEYAMGFLLGIGIICILIAYLEDYEAPWWWMMIVGLGLGCQAYYLMQLL